MSERPRTILFVHPSDELYGADRCLLDIITGLPAEFRPVVVLPTDIIYSGALSAQLARYNVRVERVDMLVLRRSLLRRGNISQMFKRLVLGSWKLARLCRQYNARIVHSNTIAVPGGAIAAMATRTPHIWHIHEHIGDEPALFRSSLQLALAVLPGRIVANSRATARSLVAGKRRTARKTAVIYNGVALPKVQKSENVSVNIAESINYIYIIGRLTPRKGIGEALQAARLLSCRGYRFQMVFVGDAPAGQVVLREIYERLAVELCIEKSVVFLGEQQNADINFESMDILLAPSQRPEGFGLTIVEAMANNVPVVAVRNGGGSDELIDHMRTGLYCEREPRSIADSLALLLNNPELRTRLAANAFVDVQRQFSLDSYQRQFVRLYRRLS